MENVFGRLIKCTPRETQTQLEGFTTELLVGMLEIADNFRIEVLRFLIGESINWINFDQDIKLFKLKMTDQDLKKLEIDTHYILPSGKRPDICILMNKKPIIFIDNKIDSMPYEEQFQNYANFSNDNHKICLILLTQYYDFKPDVKNKLGVPFRTIWWRDLYRNIIFSMYKSTYLNMLKEFARFLSEVGMGQKRNLNISDLNALKDIQAPFKILSIILNSIVLEKKMNKIDKRISNISSIKNNIAAGDLYRSCSLYTIDKDIDLVVGFRFGGSNHIITDNKQYFVAAYIALQVDPKHRFRNHIRGSLLAKKYSDWEVLNRDDNWNLITKIYPFKQLPGIEQIDNEDVQSISHIDEIVKWFIDGIDSFEEINADLIKIQDEAEQA